MTIYHIRRELHQTQTSRKRTRNGGADGTETRVKVPRIDYADRLDGMLREAGISGYKREYRFAAFAAGGPGRGLRARLKTAGLRDWRFDFAFVEQWLAIEVDGGVRQVGINPRTGEPIAVGRHAMSDDYRKINAAQLLGWRVLRYTLEMLRSGEWLDQVESALREGSVSAVTVSK